MSPQDEGFMDALHDMGATDIIATHDCIKWQFKGRELQIIATLDTDYVGYSKESIAQISLKYSK